MARRAGARITDSPEFDRVYRQGAAYRGKLFSIHAFAREAHGSPRLGLSVSKKVGKAVVRNRVRRRVREIFHVRVGELEGMGSGWDVVVSARPASSGASFRDLEREFSLALKKLEGRV